MKIIFMGTPSFSLPSLEGLLKAGYEIKGVITRPDKPKGRGLKIQPPPVKVLAERFSLPVYQPIRLREEALFWVKEKEPDLIVVVAYGGILPKELLDLPPLGCVNLHPSLLPEFRGPGAIPRCIMEGRRKTGVTTMYLDEGVDTGDIILQQEVEIGEEETGGELENRLSEIGRDLLLKTVALIERGSAPRKPQDEALSTYAPMIKKEDTLIDWSLPAKKIHNLIRALNPKPCAYTYLEGKRLKILKGKVLEGKGKPGEIVEAKKGRLIVSTPNGLLSLDEVQPEGKRKMTIREFMAGHPIEEGMKFHGSCESTS
jgi:methionyl-tRNA formyltransferase